MSVKNTALERISPCERRLMDQKYSISPRVRAKQTGIGAILKCCHFYRDKSQIREQRDKAVLLHIKRNFLSRYSISYQ